MEHLSKEEGTNFLRSLEAIGRKKVIVTTPNRYLPQGVVEGNVFEIHRSAWSISDLKKLGFRVRGVGLMMKPPCMLPSIVRRPLWLLDRLMAPLSEVFPRMGNLLLGTKELKWRKVFKGE